MRSHIAALIVLSLTASAERPTRLLAATADPASNAARVDQLFETWDTRSSPGCAVAVMKDGKIIYERGYGMADLAHDVKITPSTVFHVASMSKQFTATSILMLAQDGKLSLDDPIRKYLPELPDFGVPVRLRELLHHTSGLRDQWELLVFDGWRLDSPDLVTDGDILYLMSRQKDLNFPPGSDFMYCNTGYTLLAQVVARVSGESLRKFTTSQLFEPLGMKNTHFRDNYAEIVKNVAYAYASRRTLEVSVPNFDTVGATSLLTTVEDLARWDENFYTGKVGGAKVIQQLQERGKLNNGTSIDYAAGLFIYKYRGLQVVDHAGTDAGYVTDMMRFPEQHFTVASLCNLSSIDPTEMNERVADIYLASELEPAARPATAFRARPEELRSKVGTYLGSPGDRILRLQLKDGSLWADYFGQSFKVEALSESRFRIPDDSSELEFSNDGTSHLEWARTIVNLGTETSRQFNRVAAYSPTAADLRSFTGTYRSPELDVPYVVTLDKGHLILHPPKMDPCPLLPAANDLFVSGDWRIRFTRDARRRVSGFLINTGRVRNLRFERSPT
jgi:CubicO group peptidase (beta-lactamase class C family)